MRHAVPLALLVVASVGSRPRADSDPPGEDQLIVPDDPEVTKPPAPAPKPSEPEHVHTMEEVTIPTSYLRFGINFFGDASLRATYPDEPHTAFAIGTLGVRMLGELGPSLDALAELAFETTGEGPLADVEQLAIRWRAGGGLLEVGRFHTEIGYWNTAYHHGLWLQTPIERPHGLRFEDDGGIAPVHWVGAQYIVKRATSSGELAATLALGNGRGQIIDDVRVTDDTNDAKAVLVKGRFRRSGLELGGGALYDLIAPASPTVRPALPDRRIHELGGNAYLVWQTAGPLIILEGHAFHHVAGDQRWTTLAGYALAGYSVTNRVRPYAAVDVLRGADADPFFTPDPATAPGFDLVEVIGGVRFETSTWSALKLELRFDRPRVGDGDTTAIANWSFGL